MGGGGRGEKPPSMHLESPMKNRKKPRLPTARAMEILTDFKIAETRNLEIDAKLLKARSLRLQRSSTPGSLSLPGSLAASVTSSPTRGVVPESAPESPLRPDPRESHTSAKLIEKGILARNEFQKAQFVKDLERERAEQQWRQRRELERALQSQQRADARKARAAAVLQAALDKQSSDTVKYANKHVSAMQRSEKLIEANNSQTKAKIESLTTTEQTRLKHAQQKAELNTLKHMEAKVKEFEKNQEKRMAELFKAETSETRQKFLEERKHKEASFKTKLQEMREKDAEARKAALAAKLARVTSSVEKKNLLIMEKSLKAQAELVHKLAAAEARYCKEMSALDGKRAVWKSKESDHLSSYQRRKAADAARQKDLILQARQELILRDEMEELATKAINSKHMPPPVLPRAAED